MTTTATRATRATRPLIEYPMYFESQYCFECMELHMMEVTRRLDLLCHGLTYYQDAQTARTHYARRLGKGFELVPITQAQPLPLAWQMAEELADSYTQDW